eukprot:CAMPEP_0179858818 /NCGR_PEP_ID=MMETSP0982-20121206/12654_1 /TAXON_ID=483367 /ORGANISM="non described non described, Strain CCMP 2436" /LENGTH=44 /DNA_ID= /DNA_START= /DNA_END= /DNA_ORIENTATION=
MRERTRQRDAVVRGAALEQRGAEAVDVAVRHVPERGDDRRAAAE